MLVRRFLTTIAVIGFTAVPVLAQAPSLPTKPTITTPATPTAPTPAQAVQSARPTVTTPTTTTPATKRTNLNTATDKELDALPEVGKARSKVIMDERAKSPFKDWADFDRRMTGTSVNAGVKERLKDLVSF